MQFYHNTLMLKPRYLLLYQSICKAHFRGLLLSLLSCLSGKHPHEYSQLQ